MRTFKATMLGLGLAVATVSHAAAYTDEERDLIQEEIQLFIDGLQADKDDLDDAFEAGLPTNEQTTNREEAQLLTARISQGDALIPLIDTLPDFVIDSILEYLGIDPPTSPA